MPSQQYEPPNSGSAGYRPGDTTGQAGDTTEQQPGERSTREQPAVWSGSGEQTPGAPSPSAYGTSGSTSASETGSWSRSDSSYDTGGTSTYGEDSQATPTDIASVRAREKEAFGGVKIGTAFFGWLTAVGATVILVAIVAAVASALDVRTTVDGSSDDPSALGLQKIIAGLAILFVAYYCGGYVAGRMARFNGARQGVAVWFLAVVIAAVLTLLGFLFDTDNDLARNVSLPDFRVEFDGVTTETLIAIGIVLGVTLIGAIIGGLTGMRFHRRVDRAGFAPDPY